MIVITCAKYKKNLFRTVDATERTRFSKSRTNDLEDIGQGQGSSHATHPLMLLIICTKYGKNPSWTVDATGWTRKVNGQTDGQTDRQGESNIPPTPNFVARGIKNMSPAVLVHLIKSRINPVPRLQKLLNTYRLRGLITWGSLDSSMASNLPIVSLWSRISRWGLIIAKTLSLSASWKLHAIMKLFSSSMTFCSQYVQSRSPIGTVGRECLPAYICNLCELTRNRVIARWCFLFWIHRRWGSMQKSVLMMRLVRSLQFGDKPFNSRSRSIMNLWFRFSRKLDKKLQKLLGLMLSRSAHRTLNLTNNELTRSAQLSWPSWESASRWIRSHNFSIWSCCRRCNGCNYLHLYVIKC